MPELDTSYYPTKFVSKDSATAADGIRIITWDDDRRVVIDENGIGLRSVKRFGSIEGAGVRTPGQTTRTGSGTTWSLYIDPQSYYYFGSLEGPAYAVTAVGDQYSVALDDGSNLVPVAMQLEVSTNTYTSRLTPDFNAAQTYTLTIDAPNNGGTIAQVDLTQFLLSEHMVLATMSYEGIWTLGNTVKYYDDAGGLSLYAGGAYYENGAARIAFVTHPSANAYDEYPFNIRSTYTPQGQGQITKIINSISEEITANFVIDNQQVTSTYQAQVLDLFNYGSYAFPAGSSYNVTFKRTAWTDDTTSGLVTFTSFPIGVETQYAVP